MLGDCVSDISSDNEDGYQIYDDIHDDADVDNDEEKEPENDEDNAAREPYSEYDNVDADLEGVFDEDNFLDADLEKENLDSRYELLKDRNKELKLKDFIMLRVEKEIVDDCVNRLRMSMDSSGGTNGARTKSGRHLSKEKVDEFTRFAFNDRLPNSHHLKKAEQLETLLCLYKAYEAKKLKPDLLYFYLKFHVNWLTEMSDAIKSNSLIFFKDIPNHLANLPPGWLVLADRGFAFDALKYPNLNAHITRERRDKI